MVVLDLTFPILAFFVLLDIVTMVVFWRSSFVGYFVGLFSFLVGLYAGLNGAYGVSYLFGLFSLFVMLLGGVTVLVCGLKINVVGKV